jgi:threonine dehydratase
METPEYSDITNAASEIEGLAHKTPHLSSKSINDICGCNIVFKCENLQKVGAFKFRGATNAVRKLDETDAKKGVATHSSGNHAQALALAAKMRGIPATIVMPENAPQVKIDAVAGYGAEIIFCEPTLEARESNLQKVIDEKGSTFIHPYNNFNVIAGQGTAAKELIEDNPDLDFILAPVGGGGLLSGTSIAAKHLSQSIKVIGCEPKGADDAYRSLKAGELIPSVNPNTICDGLLTSLGEMTFEIIKNNVDEIITVDDDAIIEAMKLIWMRMKIIVEPSSAVALAVIMQNKEKFQNRKIGIIISGGNVDLKKIASL